MLYRSLIPPVLRVKNKTIQEQVVEQKTRILSDPGSLTQRCYLAILVNGL